MGNSGSIPQDQHFVVVGGGYGGVAVARGLRDSHCRFTLISDRDYFHHCIASVRAAVIKGYAKKTLLPLKDIFGENFKLGRVVGIDAGNKKLRLETGEEVSYDVLIIATGTTGGFPNKLASQDAQTATIMYEELAARIERAGRILVIGGGATGTEQACEIITKYPEKQVTLIASRDYLVTDKVSASFQAKLMAILERLKLKVIKGEHIVGLNDLDLTQDGPFSVTTDKGTALEADLILKCIGLRINTEAYKDSLSGAVDTHGQLKINQYLQVEGHEDIYAIGDCATNDDKRAYVAMEQSKHLINNFKNKYSGKPMHPWNYDKAIPVVTVLALGPTSGLGQTNGGFILPEFLMRSLKSKDLLVPRTWKENGLSVPK